MKFYITTRFWFRFFLVLCVFSVAMFVRLWNMEYIPHPDDADQLAHVFAGESLHQYGRPISWSSFSYVERKWYSGTVPARALNTTYEVNFVNPWFDHPFVTSLLVGGWTKVVGYSFPEVPPAIIYRMPMLIVSCVTLFLIFALAMELYGYWAGLFSLALVSFSPVFIFGQRMVIGENFITMFFLAALYCVLKKQPVIFPILSSVLAICTKMTGLFVIPIMFSLLLFRKEYKKAIVYGIGTIILTVSLYGVYGWGIGGSEFFESFVKQAYRLVGWSNPAFLFSHPGFLNVSLLDLSYYVTLLGGILFFVHCRFEKKCVPMWFIALIVLCTVWATSAEQDNLGWYKIPLFSLCAIGAGQLVKVVSPFSLSLLMVTVIVNNFGLVRYPTHLFPEAILVRGILAMIIGLSFFYILLKEYFGNKFYIENVTKVLLVGIMVVYMVQSVYIVAKFFEAKCTDTLCVTPTYTLKDVIKKRSLYQK